MLNIKNSRSAVAKLDADEKNTVVLNDGIQGNPTKSIVFESGLYALIMRSDKFEALKFRKWVTSEVLPQIRKTGAYIPSQPTIQISPLMVASLLKSIDEAFWKINEALMHHRVIEGELSRAKKQTISMMGMVKEAFPDAKDIFDEIPRFASS